MWGGLNELPFAQRADRTPVAVSPQDNPPELSLVVSPRDLRKLVAPRVLRRLQPLPRRIAHRKTDLHDHGSSRRIVIRDEHWKDDLILPGIDSEEVHKGSLDLKCGSEGPVVGLIDGPCSIVVQNRPGVWVENILVGTA